MKNTKLSFFGAIAIALATFMAGCSDPCKDVTCVNGECVEGDCVCDAGYEGVDCGTAQNAKFAGTFDVAETCTSGSYTYVASVVASSTDAGKIVINDLYVPGVSATADIADNGTDFTIASQALGSGTVSGTGSINATGTAINISYTVDDGQGNTDSCQATFTKQ